MTPVLPDILFEEQYKDQWGWEGWKPKAKVNASKKLKDTIDEWVREIEALENEEFDSEVEEIEEI